MKMCVPCLTVTVLEDAPAPGGESKSGDGPDTGVLDPGTGRCNCVSCWGGGELAEVEPTDPGSLNPCVLLSSGVSKKLRLNSEPASKDTSGVILSGDGALPKLPLSDWSILKTSMLAQLEVSFTWSHVDHTPAGQVVGAARTREPFGPMAT